MTSAYWPLGDLRLTMGDLRLRPMTEGDLGTLSDLLPADVEMDPSLPRLPGQDEHARRGLGVHQMYWRHLGGWQVDDWALDLVVEDAGRVVGVQVLEGRDFARLRVVETASWVGRSARGRGVGRGMRLAVLALAFDGLGAVAAASEAWHDNVASLRVSRALGYLDNGSYRHARGDGADTMVRLWLPARRFRDLHPAHEVSITGLDGCLGFFGAADR